MQLSCMIPLTPTCLLETSIFSLVQTDSALDFYKITNLAFICTNVLLRHQVNSM